MTLRATLVAAGMVRSATAQAQPPGLEAIKASNAYIDCLMKAAHRLDDGHSDAAGVGKSIQGACLAQQHRWENAQTVNFSADRKRSFLEEIKAHTAMVAVTIVLEERRFKRN